MAITEVPEKKKGAIGVRGMRVGAKEEMTAAWYLGNGEMITTKTDKGEVHLERLHLASRDTRGVKH